jgi:hypothetical protein
MDEMNQEKLAPDNTFALTQMAPPGAQTCPDGAARRSNLPGWRR